MLILLGPNRGIELAFVVAEVWEYRIGLGYVPTE